MVVGLTIKTDVNIRGRRLLLPETYREFAFDLMTSYARSTVRAIKYRAPVATGNLRRNIKLDRANKKTLVRTISIDSGKVPYWEALEKGWTGHWIPLLVIKEHYGSNGTYRFNKGDWINKRDVKASGGMFLSTDINYDGRGFIKRGFDASKRNFANYVDESFNKIVKTKR